MNPRASPPPDIASEAGMGRLLRVTLALFLSYLAVALSLSAMAVHAARDLGLGNALSGLAVAVPFLSTILTRGYAGSYSDRIGGKVCAMRGLVLYMVANLICLASTWFAGLGVWPAYGVLIAGRLLLGLGESLTLIGVNAWAMAMAGPARSGRVLAMVGIAMYGALAIGGPIGLIILQTQGFSALMLLCAVLPLTGLVMATGLPATAPHAGKRASFWQVLRQIWREGAVVGLQGVGFGVIGAFIPLYFLAKGWPHAGLGLTCFGGGFVLVRAVLGHLPDKIGGCLVARWSIAISAVGQYLLWQASSPALALVGCLLTGLGCSMIFPSMGLEVVRRMPRQLHGTAIGGFAAYQDMAYGATGPLAGLLADHYGYGSVFLAGALCATLGFLLVPRR